MGAPVRPRIPLSQDVYTLACERTAQIMERYDNVNVSFSGGKDSTATLMVALDVAHSDPKFERHLPLRVIHYDEEAIPYETEEYVRRIGQRDDVALEWLCVPVQQRNACSRRSPYWWPWAPESEELWCRPLPPEAITHIPGMPTDPDERPGIPGMQVLTHDPAKGSHIQLLGIRAAESLSRLRMVSHKPVDNYISPGQAAYVQKGYPVYDWTVEDVWTAPAVKGWDYNRAYDRMEMAGVSATGQRCSPAFGEEPIKGLHLYAQCFPDVWEKMVDRVPGVGAAVRYARTELYSHGSRPEKPLDMTWPDFLTHYLRKYEPDVTRKLAERLAGELRLHYRKTTDPIVVAAVHPASGLSWNHLLALAMRGDFKMRRFANANIPNTDQTRRTAWRKYATELAEVIAEGAYSDLSAPRPAPADPWALVPAEYREATP